MIAKHVPMRSLGKSDFAGLANYITDAQSKDHRLGQVLLTNCSAATASGNRGRCCNQYINTRAKSDKTYHPIVSFRAGEQPSADRAQGHRGTHQRRAGLRRAPADQCGS